MTPPESNYNSHCSYPVFLRGRAAAQHGDKIGAKSNQLQGEMNSPPQSYGVSFWELSGTLTLSHKTSFPNLPCNHHSSNSEEKNDQPECVALDHSILNKVSRKHKERV